jgi:hypothetical protein
MQFLLGPRFALGIPSQSVLASRLEPKEKSMPIYRKAPPQPPRLLLRIVATAGAGALLSTAACSDSGSNHPFNGLVGMPSSGASSGSATSGSSSGSTSGDSGASSGGPVGVTTGFYGSVTMPPDDAGHPPGVVVMPPPEDAGNDADHHPPGIVVMPPHDDAGPHCQPCGVVVMPSSDAGYEAATWVGGGVQPAPDDAGHGE